MRKEITIKQRAQVLVHDMSLEEKLGQIVCCWPKPEMEPEKILEEYPAGVGVISLTNARVLENVKDVAAFQKKWQKAAMEKSPHNIPAIFHTEGLCGALIPEAMSFPTGIARASSWDEELELKIGRIVSRQSAAVGASHVLAPVLDISRDPRNGRQGETYGEDPTLAAVLGTAYTKGIQEEKNIGMQTEAVAKHFVGFHGSTGGIQSAHFETGERQLKEVYVKPFQAAVTEADLRGVMPCYSAVNGMFPSVSQELLTTLLREEMGFDGLAVSDYNAVSGIHNGAKIFESRGEAGYEALHAGLDVEMPQKDCFGAELKELFLSGKISMTILDQAVERILEAKLRMGLFEHPFALQEEALKKVFSEKEDSEISLQSARESLVLLKNDGLLPLSAKPEKIALIGPHIATARSFFGGYTHYSMTEGSVVKAKEQKAGEQGKHLETWPGSCVLKDDDPAYETLLKKLKPDCRSLLEEAEIRFGKEHIAWERGYDVAGTDTSGFDSALRLAEEADLVVLTIGGKYGTRKTATMAEGVDSVNINLPPAQENFLRKLEKLGKKVIGIHMDGRPLSSNAAEKTCNAILEAWSLSEMGASAIWDVLTGVYTPSGKLPVSVAYSAGQIPVYYNMPNASGFLQAGSIGFADYADCPHRPRYPFGYGLSYTYFSYHNLVITPENDRVIVCFTVENVGNVEGTEIAQLYYRDQRASRLRPGMELAGFVRVPLRPGEKKTVMFTLCYSQMAFLDGQFRWKTEAGDIEVMVGASSEDIRLRERFHIEADCFPDGRKRSFWAKGVLVERGEG